MFPKGASHLNHTFASPMPEFPALYSLGMEGTFEPSKIRAKICSGQVSRGSAGEYQADEWAGVAGLSWRVSG